MRDSGFRVSLFAICTLLLSLAANFLFLLTCVSPTVQNLALYRVDVAHLAEDLHDREFGRSKDDSQTDLLHPNLPTHWLWGISGVCDVYPDKTHCRRGFLPTQDILTLVKHSLTRSPNHGTENRYINKVLAAWNRTLTHLDTPDQRKRAAKFDTLSKAGAALVIIAIILDMDMWFGPSYWWHSMPYSFYSALLGSVAIGAGICLVVALPHGLHTAAAATETGPLAVIIVFIGGATRLIASLTGCWASHDGSSRFSSPSTLTRQSRPQVVRLQPKDAQPIIPASTIGSRVTHDGETRPRSVRPLWNENFDRDPPRSADFGHISEKYEQVGYLGEKYIFDLFKARRIPKWSEANWTSSLRSRHGLFSKFSRSLQKIHADFTYLDTRGAMRRALRKEGVTVCPTWSNRTTYHLEVKTTPGGLWTPFELSKNQKRLLDLYEDDLYNAYIP
ncbi:hypothetical protein QBC41DRAFT_288115 [Cercophora samala]|uniref:Uncharacterized protein n=1 Tax=Cercophora samala TaxID=330535 RepID=A0AA40CWD8_9PEZI|nr:hypothetical protein QBC41DRAFT_288115 [Cercophora samala]